MAEMRQLSFFNTSEQEKAKQEEIAKWYNLSWWYYTGGKKCCGVYPEFKTEGNTANEDIYLECPVCGRRTKGQVMPWIAEEEWDRCLQTG